MHNKYALILGGSSGLGLATAKKLASKGYNLCIVHRDRKSDLALFTSEIERLKSHGIAILTFNKDALKEETMAEVVAALPDGAVKVVVHSIAKGVVKPMLSADGDELSLEDFTITLNAMALSWYSWVKALIKAQKFSDNARNIAFTSEGNTKAWKFYGAVSAAKATLESLMRQMAIELATIGITSNCVQAGVTQTKSFQMIPGSEQLAELAKRRNPFHRLTLAEDVANAVYLLCTEEAGWINGTVLKVDGGESLR